MRIERVPAVLAVLAGTAALAQPTLDGRLSGDAQYTVRWLQGNNTGFGDNRADLCSNFAGGIDYAINNSNVAGVNGNNAGGDQSAAAASVATGFEIRIPFSKIGNPTGSIRLVGYITNGDQGFMSNQIFGGMPDGSNNISSTTDPRNVVFDSLPGGGASKIMTVANPGSPPVVSVTVDGTKDGAYGAALYNQTLGTQFGDSTNGSPTCATGGSEIDNVYAFVSQNGGNKFLNIFVGGNLEANGNRINIFIDSVAGGQHRLLGGNPGNGGLQRLSDDGSGNGQTFPTGFDADYFLTLSLGGCPTISGAFASLPTAAGGSGGDIPAVCPPSDYLSLGSELDGIYSYLDKGGRKLYVLATGNWKEGEFLHLFFDCNGNPAGDKGQNRVGVDGADDTTVRDNVQIGVPDDLHKLGADGVPDISTATNGLKFDSDFYADFWVAVHFEATTRTALDAAVLRTHGIDYVPNTTNPLDYGAYSAALVNSTIPYDGSSLSGGPTATPPGINLQDGSVGHIFSAFGPRASRKTLDAFIAARGGYVPTPDNTEWSNYVAAHPLTSGLIQAQVRNNNVAGVTDTLPVAPDGGTQASSATTGLEIAISLAELGWNNKSRIRVAGFVSNSDVNYLANQVVGGLPGGSGNLMDPKNVDFSGIAGNQWAVVAYCLADFNQDGNVTVQDIFDFLTAWFGHLASANVSGHAGNPSPQDIFDFLALWFMKPCL